MPDNDSVSGMTDTTKPPSAEPKLRDVLLFLDGVAPLDGCMFGERPVGQGAFWWRSHLKAAIESALGRIAPSDVLREALTKCRDQFAFYAREHKAAGKVEKAATNQSFADLADAALSTSTETPSTAEKTYRGWSIEYVYPPIPTRAFDWSATHPDYDGAEDANDNRHVYARTREAVQAEVDAWIEENGDA